MLRDEKGFTRARTRILNPHRELKIEISRILKKFIIIF